MTLSRDYRSRAAHVRRSARAHLKEIRRARLARKEAEGPVDTLEPAAPPPHEAEDTLPEPPLAEAPLQPEDELASFEQIDTPPASEPAPPVEAETVEHAALADMFDEAPDMAANEAAPPDDIEPPETTGDCIPSAEPEVLTAETDDHDLAAADEPTAVDPPETGGVETSVADAEPDLTQSDLNTLPGAGPGLVWMLHQCGVSSLADLAQSDPEELTPKLGVVGQILDVNKWIDFAANEARPAN